MLPIRVVSCDASTPTMGNVPTARGNHTCSQSHPHSTTGASCYVKEKQMKGIVYDLQEHQQHFFGTN